LSFNDGESKWCTEFSSLFCSVLWHFILKKALLIHTCENKFIKRDKKLFQSWGTWIIFIKLQLCCLRFDEKSCEWSRSFRKVWPRIKIYVWCWFFIIRKQSKVFWFYIFITWHFYLHSGCIKLFLLFNFDCWKVKKILYLN